MNKKRKVAIIGSGNIGLDLMYKVKKSKNLELSIVIGRAASKGLLKASEEGFLTSDKGIQAIVENPSIADIIFDATTAKAHLIHGPILKKLGKKVIDLTPAAIGVKVAPAINMEENLEADNINLVSCGGQAVLPIVWAVNQVAEVEYAEVINASASKGVGPGTRANVDEYTQETGDALVEVAKAKKGKAIIVINPAEPPIAMHNTVFTIVKGLNKELAEKIDESVKNIIEKVQSYVPGYKMSTPPQFDYERNLVTTMVEIEGAGDYLPKYAGNLDIITQAAVAVAENFAQDLNAKGGI